MGGGTDMSTCEVSAWDQSLVREDWRNDGGASNLAFNEKVKKLQNAGQEIAHFAFGQSPFPIPEVAVNALREHAGEHAYLAVAGTPELREAICSFHKRHDGIELDPDQLLVGPGSKELLYLTMNVFNGDLILLAPAWTTYEPQSRLAGKQATILRTHAENQYKVTGADLEALFRSRRMRPHRMMVLTNPGNPTGLQYTEQELRDLSEACRRHQVIVLSDEIYGRLSFDGTHVSMAKLYPEGTILTSGFSKWLSAGGWRLGYAHYPAGLAPLKVAVRSAASNTFSCAPAPMQRALAAALQPEHAAQLDGYATSCARVLQAVGDFCYRELISVGVKANRSQAAYYFMPDFEVCRSKLAARGITTGQQMVDAMLQEADIALMASSCFLMSPLDLVTRFCFVCFDGAAALAAADDGRPLDDAFLQQYCAQLVAGIRRLQDWVRRNSD